MDYHDTNIIKKIYINTNNDDDGNKNGSDDNNYFTPHESHSYARSSCSAQEVVMSTGRDHVS